MVKNNHLISALFKIVGAYPKRNLVAWDFPSRVFKKSYEDIGQVLKEHGIEYQRPPSEWGHISIGLVKPLTKSQKQDILKAAPVFKSSVSVKGVIVLPGQEFTFVGLEIKVGEEYLKFYEFLVDLLGEENVNKPPSYPYFKPHVSVLTTSKEDFEKVNALTPEMEAAIKRYTTSFTPKQIQVWGDDFKISEIEENILR